jgi:hypothetical protein
MAMTQDSMAYLKNGGGNAPRYYLRSEVDQYLFLRVLYSLPYPCTASILWRVF